MRHFTGFITGIAVALSIAASSMILTACCGFRSDPPAAPGKGFRLGFTLSHGENSKDCHEIVYSCVISEGRAVYSGPYGDCVRGQCNHKKIEFDLTPGQFEELLALVNSEGLYTDFTEILARNGIGTWVSASLVITDEGKSGRVRIDGMVNNWSKHDKAFAKEISARAKEHMLKMDRLRRFFSTVAKGHFPEYH